MPENCSQAGKGASGIGKLREDLEARQVERETFQGLECLTLDLQHDVWYTYVYLRKELI